MQKCVNFGLVALIALMLMPSVLGLDLDLNVEPEQDVFVVGVDEPAMYTISITNEENVSDSFKIFSLVEPWLFPKESVTIEPGETAVFDMTLTPRDSAQRQTLSQESSRYTFSYQVKGKVLGSEKRSLTVNIIELSDLISVNMFPVDPEDSETTITLTNNYDYEADELQFRASSGFFDHEQSVSLEPYEQENITIPLQESEVSAAPAGLYEADVVISKDEAEALHPLEFRVIETQGVASSEVESGFIVQRKTIEKMNDGNVPAEITVTESVNMFERLFTTFSRQADSVSRNGLSLEYTWQEVVEPSQALVVNSVTNYTFPFVFIVVVALIGFIVRVSFTRSLNLEKRVSYVRTKGGEFALKVRLRASARKNLSNVKVMDKIPTATKLYTGYGTRPHDIDEATRKVAWNLDVLNAGEERTFSYIIYSKLNMLGKFSLPMAHASYELGGKTERIQSNKTSFVSESSAVDIPEAMPSMPA